MEDGSDFGPLHPHGRHEQNSWLTGTDMPSLAIAAIWGIVTQQMDLFLSLLLSVFPSPALFITVTFNTVNKSKNKKENLGQAPWFNRLISHA